MKMDSERVKEINDKLVDLRNRVNEMCDEIKESNIKEKDTDFLKLLALKLIQRIEDVEYFKQDNFLE